ncbi:hypothetical protein QWZ08_05470 [Ferruginibacter paludis]|uniref:hypothetical protein n=1 Tax=Ferruginibacter paludis TaxID=1310417 RepID=UPI0025B5411E|nr:hypothetical protein [Ferruginibacter paludis]MDN3655063.1 hypothetical protein [Ferruginibacter paludis]
MVCRKIKRYGNFYMAILIALCCSLTLLNSSCKKLKLLSGDQSTLEQYFADNVLGKTFVVDFASDSSVDITSQYAGYDFILTKTTSFYEGDMTGTKDGITYTGTWSSNSDYSKLIINLNSSNIPASFAFLNRSWKFTKKGVPVLELAPWGSADPKVLHMRRL